MSPLLDALDNEQQAFVIGTSYHVQFYETQEGARYARQRDGSYSAGAESYPTLFDLLEQTAGPLSPGQLYALLAIYHPLVTARVSADREPQRMSRSEARAFILEEFADITPFDLKLEAGTLHFAAKDQRHRLTYPERAEAAEPPPPPPPPPSPKLFTAEIEVTYVADEGLSQEDIQQRVERDASFLIGQPKEGEIEARRVKIVNISQAAEELHTASGSALPTLHVQLTGLGDDADVPCGNLFGDPCG